ncbi:MAG TPA: BTAD domain-containing putative transcriptional regulator [Longimicrobiales bacterium]|nr:BTAD domain-containing putative transcriptional regulator [Longimicrobiales bacterium]
MIRLRTLGRIEISRSGEAAPGDAPDPAGLLGQAKPTALLAYLALARPDGEGLAEAERIASDDQDPGASACVHRRDALAALFWPGSSERRARAALSQALYVLRQWLGRDAVRSYGVDAVGLASGALESDAAAFRNALADGRPRDALELYDGPFLPGLDLPDATGFGRWFDGERADLAANAAGAAWSLAEEAERRGNVAGAGHWVRRAVEASPDDDATARRALETLARLGDAAGALRVYDALVERRFAPGAEAVPGHLRELAERLRSGAPAPRRAPARSTSWTGRRAGFATASIALAVVVLSIVTWREIGELGPERAEASVLERASAELLPLRAAGTTDPRKAELFTDGLGEALARAGLALVSGPATSDAGSPVARDPGAHWVIAGDLIGEAGASDLALRIIEIDEEGRRQVWAASFREGGRPTAAFLDHVAAAVVERLARK